MLLGGAPQKVLNSQECNETNGDVQGYAQVALTAYPAVRGAEPRYFRHCRNPPGQRQIL